MSKKYWYKCLNCGYKIRIRYRDITSENIPACIFCGKKPDINKVLSEAVFHLI